MESNKFKGHKNDDEENDGWGQLGKEWMEWKLMSDEEKGGGKI